MICIYFIFAFSEIFFSIYKAEDNIFYTVLLYVGPAEKAAKYTNKVS
jgi:hypothetical protein